MHRIHSKRPEFYIKNRAPPQGRGGKKVHVCQKNLMFIKWVVIGKTVVQSLLKVLKISK